jgi:hypothetical protein
MEITLTRRCAKGKCAALSVRFWPRLELDMARAAQQPWLWPLFVPREENINPTLEYFYASSIQNWLIDLSVCDDAVALMGCSSFHFDGGKTEHFISPRRSSILLYVRVQYKSSYHVPRCFVSAVERSRRIRTIQLQETVRSHMEAQNYYFWCSSARYTIFKTSLVSYSSFFKLVLRLKGDQERSDKL